MGEMRSAEAARAALLVLVASALAIGLPATFAPQSFYEEFPYLSSWVSLLPPYNEHLVTDVGGLYLGFAVLFGWAAWTLQPTLVRAACSAWLATATIHLAFHATHLEGFSAGDAIAELAALAFLLVPPAVAIWAVRASRKEERGEGDP